ncbi:MAG: ferrous iron transport protein A [Armatimonadetes bacterium]|nr:ferrous iron transport protein A [Armatimonadota bacterium]
MPLTEAPHGRRVRVVAVEGGRQVGLRLAGLGLTVGSDVRSLINHGRGPILIVVRGTRLALGRGLAARIKVEERDG